MQEDWTKSSNHYQHSKFKSIITLPLWDNCLQIICFSASFSVIPGVINVIFLCYFFVWWHQMISFSDFREWVISSFLAKFSSFAYKKYTRKNATNKYWMFLTFKCRKNIKRKIYFVESLALLAEIAPQNTSSRLFSVVCRDESWLYALLQRRLGRRNVQFTSSLRRSYWKRSEKRIGFTCLKTLFKFNLDTKIAGLDVQEVKSMLPK